MAQLDPAQAESGRASMARRLLFYIGSTALLAVMAIETIAVLGRHIGWPVLGAIEMIQSAILIAACASTVIATVHHAHAVVHLLTDRLRPPLQAALFRITAMLSALFFVALAIGAAWLARDFWHAHEETELLHISLRPLRIAMTVAIAAVAAAFVYYAVTGRRRPR